MLGRELKPQANFLFFQNKNKYLDSTAVKLAAYACVIEKDIFACLPRPSFLPHLARCIIGLYAYTSMGTRVLHSTREYSVL